MSATVSTACMNKRLADREFLAGDYSIADMAVDRLDAGL